MSLVPSCAFAMVASPRALAFNSDDPVCIAPIRFLPPSEVMRLYASPCRVLTPLLHRKSALLSRSGRFVLAAVPALPCRASVGSTFVSTHVPSVSRVGSFRCIPSDGVSILSLPWPSLLAAPCFGQLFVCSTGDSAQFAVAAPRAPKLVPCSTSVGPVPWSAHVVAYASRILQSLALLLPTFSLILSSWFLLHGAQVLPRFSDGSASVHTAAADGSGLRPLALRSAMHCSCSSAPCSQHVLLGLSRPPASRCSLCPTDRSAMCRLTSTWTTSWTSCRASCCLWCVLFANPTVVVSRTLVLLLLCFQLHVRLELLNVSFLQVLFLQHHGKSAACIASCDGPVPGAIRPSPLSWRTLRPAAATQPCAHLEWLQRCAIGPSAQRSSICAYRAPAHSRPANGQSPHSISDGRCSASGNASSCIVPPRRLLDVWVAHANKSGG